MKALFLFTIVIIILGVPKAKEYFDNIALNRCISISYNKLKIDNLSNEEKNLARIGLYVVCKKYKNNVSDVLKKYGK